MDGALIIDNSLGKLELLASKIEGQALVIHDEKFNNLKLYYDEIRKAAGTVR